MALNNSEWEILNLSFIPISTESALSACNAIDLSDSVQLALTISNEYNVSNESATRVNLYTSYNNATWDTDPYATFDNDFTASSTIQTTVPICPDPRYMKVRIHNQNTTGNISSVSVYCSQKYID